MRLCDILERFMKPTTDRSLAKDRQHLMKMLHTLCVEGRIRQSLRESIVGCDRPEFGLIVGI